jgi:hypothetical protein
MSDPAEATMIVTLLGAHDFREAKRVESAEMCGLSGKLRVRYDRDPRRNLEIQAQIRKIIETYR